MEYVDLTIGGIALVPLIVALVEIAKQIGLETKYAPWLIGFLSVVGYVLVEGIKMYPQYENYVIMALTMLLVFLSSTGFYTVAKNTVQSMKAK